MTRNWTGVIALDLIRVLPVEACSGRAVKVRGGSSSLNGWLYVPGQAADYDHWAAPGNQDLTILLLV